MSQYFFVECEAKMRDKFSSLIPVFLGRNVGAHYPVPDLAGIRHTVWCIDYPQMVCLKNAKSAVRMYEFCFWMSDSRNGPLRFLAGQLKNELASIPHDITQPATEECKKPPATHTVRSKKVNVVVKKIASAQESPPKPIQKPAVKKILRNNVLAGVQSLQWGRSTR